MKKRTLATVLAGAKEVPVWQLAAGANVQPNGSTSFRVWAPKARSMEVKIITREGAKKTRMEREDGGYYYASVPDVREGANYYYVLDGEKDRPDPCSRYQPDGVHGASEVVDPAAFSWSDAGWKGITPADLVLYEMHTGTFTPGGTFESAIEKIPYLKKLGVTCLEIMPVAQFPGKRNWGYDGVGLYAVQNSYGGPAGLKKLVDACHAEKLAVCLDVVYNHLGPEGNYLNEFGAYFTDKYHTPWGSALNYDGPDSDNVRRFIIENALYWLTEYHIDVLRLDAIHGIYDFGAKHVLAELKERADAQAAALGRMAVIIGESDLNDSRVIRPPEQGGWNLDAQWSDDFHHALHVVLTGETKGYYEDFGGLRDLATALGQSYVYDWKYSRHRGRHHGNSAAGLPGEKFVHYIQNHDQVGNRAWGDRISKHISFEAQKLAAVLVMMGPHIPMIWMGQEYGEDAPFQYFIDHGDPNLIQAVREGRKNEFKSFGWDEVPDPAAPATFEASKLQWNLASQGRHALVLKLYQDLAKLRKQLAILRYLNRSVLQINASEDENWVAFEYQHEEQHIGVLASFNETERVIKFPFHGSAFEEILNTEDEKYGGFLAKSEARRYGRQFLLNWYGAVVGRVKR